MGAVEVVVVQPRVELLMALERGLVGAGVGPFSQGGLDEALGFAVGARSIGPGEAVFDVLMEQGVSEEGVPVAAPVVGEHTADGDGVAAVIGPGHEKKRMAERWVWSGRMAAKAIREWSSMAMWRYS